MLRRCLIYSYYLLLELQQTTLEDTDQQFLEYYVEIEAPDIFPMLFPDTFTNPNTTTQNTII